MNLKKYIKKVELLRTCVNLNDCLVSYKIDGIRCALYIDVLNNVYEVNIKNWKQTKIGIYKNNKNNIRNVGVNNMLLLDCEKYKNKYYVFDLLNDSTEIKTRLIKCKKIISNISNNNIHIKSFYEYENISTMLLDNPKYKYDGLIFINKKTNISYKWKNNYTLDIYAIVNKECIYSNNGKKLFNEYESYYPISYKLDKFGKKKLVYVDMIDGRCSIKKDVINAITFTTNENIKIEDIDKKIIEIDIKYPYNIIKIRNDRKSPNTINEIKNIIYTNDNNIMDFLNIRSDYYDISNLDKNKNLQLKKIISKNKKDIINNYYGNVLDICSGRCQDLYRIIISKKIKKITLFDIDKFSYKIGCDIRKKIHSHTTKKIKIICDDINDYDFHYNIYDTISCHYGIHYLDNCAFTKIIPSLKIGGQFIITFLDGNKLLSLLKKKNVSYYENIYNDIYLDNGIVFSITESNLFTHDKTIFLKPTSYEIFIPSIGIWMYEKFITTDSIINKMNSYGLTLLSKINNNISDLKDVDIFEKDNIEFLNLYETFIFKKTKTTFPFIKYEYNIFSMGYDVFNNILEYLENIEFLICKEVSNEFNNIIKLFLKEDRNDKYIYDYEIYSDDGYNS
jgi:hypothetical protein